jgi:hypothetical protein
MYHHYLADANVNSCWSKSFSHWSTDLVMMQM